MSINHRQIEAGINYLQTIAQGERFGNIMRPKDIADNLGITEREVKDAIHAAREHRDKANKPPTVGLIAPEVKIHRELMTGRRQIVKDIEVELLKELVVKFEDAERTEFVTLMPVRVVISREV